MAKKILKFGGAALGLATGGLPGALVGGLAGLGASKWLGKKKPKGEGDPLPTGAINPDGSKIPMDSKRRRLKPKASTILDQEPGSTLGG